MMRSTWATVGMVSALGLLGGSAKAADHRDGMAVLADPSTDINDVYAWMSADGAKVYLAMTVFPAADKTASPKFSNSAKYVWHVNSKSAYGMAATATNIICTFDAAQKISCWAGGQSGSYVTGDASATAGISSADGKLKVFAGLRKDPFFFNLDGFKAVAKAVHNAASSLTFNASGCPNLPAGTAAALAGGLSHAPDSNGAPTTTMPPADFFKPLNTLAIVVAVDKTVLTKGGPILGIWGSTNK